MPKFDRVPPLGEVPTLILSALADADRHGYAIVAEVRAITGGAVSLGTGTLYGALERLVDAGQVVVAGEETVSGRLRRYYRLTGAGREALVREVDRQEQLASAVRVRLAGAT
ncbi:MAG: PadR family transcriptional regulator [Ilumatobacteraceae bacterium]